MLRRVVGWLRRLLLALGGMILLWLPLSFFVMFAVDCGAVGFRTGGGHVRVSMIEGTYFTATWGRLLRIKPQLEWGRVTLPSCGMREDWGNYFVSFVELPLWLLAAVCLAWPVTSLLVRRRRRGRGRGFAVEMTNEETRNPGRNQNDETRNPNE